MILFTFDTFIMIQKVGYINTKKNAQKHWDKNFLHLHPRSHDLEYLFCWLWGGHVFPDSLSGLVTNGCFPFTDLIAPLNRFWADPTLMGCQGKQEENISKKRLITWRHYFCYQNSYFQPRLYIDPQNGVNCFLMLYMDKEWHQPKFAKFSFNFSIEDLVARATAASSSFFSPSCHPMTTLIGSLVTRLLWAGKIWGFGDLGKISRQVSEMVSDVSTGKWRYLSPLCFEIIGKTKSGEWLFGLQPNGLFTFGLSLIGLQGYLDYRHLDYLWRLDYKPFGLHPIGLPMTFGLLLFGLHPKKTTLSLGLHLFRLLNIWLRNSY